MTDGSPHAAFDSLAEGLKRVLWDKGWKSLRPLQERAILAYAATDRDLLLMAETAGGKTEAAFLPVLSEIAGAPATSIYALYVGPLKALINDQFARVEDLCARLDVAVHRWHGDVGRGRKQALIEKPSGVLLITPESIESLLVNRSSRLPALFGGLRAIVIDELHAFLGDERGTHLQSLLARVDAVVAAAGGARPRRIGLSATIGDVEIARAYLAPDARESVAVITDAGSGKKSLLLRLHSYVASEIEEAARGAGEIGEAENDGETPDDDAPDPEAAAVDPARLRVMTTLAADLAEHTRGHANLVFANNKGDVELFAALANERCRRMGLPETFLVHHGSLARDVREDAEAAMKAGETLTTVCSSTLEMGIDIGSVHLVGQIGAPHAVASLRQRAGRSGRGAGEPRRLRVYVEWDDRLDRAHGEDLDVRALPLDLLAAIAVCELATEGFLEPGAPARFDYSTLVHQVISTISQLGAATAGALHDSLCVRGPFREVDPPRFARLLRALGAKDVIEQGADGALILGLEGERIRASRDFYAAFAGTVEYVVLAGDRNLGELPFERLPKIGDPIAFAGRRWRVTAIDVDRRAILVEPARRLKRPAFVSAGGDVHPAIRERMRALLGRSDVPPWIDAAGKRALARARAVAAAHDLARRRFLALTPNHVLLLTYTGTKAQRTLVCMLESRGLEVEDHEIGIRVKRQPAALARDLAALVATPPAALALAAHLAPLEHRKFDGLLDPESLRESAAHARLDVATALTVAAELR
jgi:ATP-dependent Lhr-like helicase